MARLAVITATNGSPLSVSKLGRGQVEGGSAYVMRDASGNNLGFYQTAGDAQRAFRLMTGEKRVIWTRSDISGQIECYVATDGQ